VPLPREVKVGAFVGFGLAVAGFVVFLIGDERRAFEPKNTYEVIFDDVQGLTRGSPVRMGGLDVGQVSSVGYGEDMKDSRLHVMISVVASESRRIRADSVATIGNKGLLGDKMIVIEVGSPNQRQVPEGSVLKSEPPQDFGAIADRLTTISEKAEAVLVNLEKTSATFADPAMQEDMRTAVHSLSGILKSVDTGEGYVSRLLHDSKEADRLSKALANLERATGQLDPAIAGLNTAIARVNQGPGLAHDLIYGEGPTQAIAQFGRAAEELATTLEGVRKGNGLAHSVLYGDDQTQQLIGDLNAITKDVRQIVEGVRQGRGTLGALMVDPSVYEDLKMLLGNVERNKALRALVRYSIQRDEKTGHAGAGVEDRTPPPSPEMGPPAAGKGEIGAAGSLGD